VINLADENSTSSRRVWRAFLEALIAEEVPLGMPLLLFWIKPS
jgi:anaerobic magnesium-protoporphyrin IX monomethyl ester cyclase